MDVARLSNLYREALAVREDAIRASLASSVAQAAAAAAALEAAEPPTLGVGKASPAAEVRRLQLLLAVRGVDVRVDGNYDKDTAKAVTEFQGSAGLEPTGVVDPATWSALSGVFHAARDLATQALAIIESVQTGVSEALAHPGDRLAESLTAETLAAESFAAESLAAESLALESTAAEPLAAEPLAAEPLAGGRSRWLPSRWRRSRSRPSRWPRNRWRPNRWRPNRWPQKRQGSDSQVKMPSEWPFSRSSPNTTPKGDCRFVCGPTTASRTPPGDYCLVSKFICLLQRALQRRWRHN